MTQGFFKKTAKAKTPFLFDEQTMLPTVPACKKCGLDRFVITPRMPYSGEGKERVFILGEGPGATEDFTGLPFHEDADAGGLFHRTAQLYGFNLRRDAYIQNAVNCRPTFNNEGKANRPPKSGEIAHCRPLWQQSLDETKPKFIWLMGGSAIEAFFGNRRSKVYTMSLSVDRWHRLCIPDPISRAWVIPLYHPSFFVRNKYDTFYLEHEIQFAVQQLQRPEPEFPDEKKRVILKQNFDEVCDLLDFIYEFKIPFAHDYETNCLKPWREGSYIASIAVSFSGKEAFAFPFEYPGHWNERQIRIIHNKWCKILSDPEIPKIVQNYQMEGSWADNHLVHMENFHWDTMVAAHVIDGRNKYSGLKFQTLLHFGTVGYGDHVEHLLEGFPFNKVNEIPLPDLLLYNGMDAMFTMRLYELQSNELLPVGSKLRESAYHLFHEGVETSMRMESRGIPINVEHYAQEINELSDRQDKLKSRLLNDLASQEFSEQFKREPNFESSDDLKILLYKIMQEHPTKFTEKQNISVDEEVLEGIDTPFTKQLIKRRKLKKIQDYIKKFMKIQVNGYLHPGFNLHSVTTYRSSSSEPNFQNLPKRSKEAELIVRSGIIPSPGNFILEVDYGAMEVRIICCCSQDPILAGELNAGIDIHQFWADFFKEEGVSRYDTKNGFVFPLFYGSWYENIHKDLVSRGYKLSVDKVQAAEKSFWDKYHHTLEYRDRQIKDYKRKGYVETLFGFRRHGYLRKTQIINTPVQAAAFHCLQWSLNRLDRQSIEQNWLSQFRGQIHDAMFVDTHPTECRWLIPLIERVMTKDIREAHPWIIVPLLAEFSCSEEDGNWFEMINH